MSIKDKFQKNPLGYLFSHQWHFAEEERGRLVRMWLMFVVSSLVSNLCVPFIWAKIMNTLQVEGLTESSLKTLLFMLLLTLVAEVCAWVFHGPARCMEKQIAFNVRVRYRKFLLRGVLTLPMNWHVEHHTGATIDKIEKGANALYSFSEGSFEILYAVLKLVISCAMLMYFSPTYGGLAMCIMVVAFYLTSRFDQTLLAQYKELNRSENRISERVNDAVTNISTVIILRVERQVFESIVRMLTLPFNLVKRNMFLNESKWFLVECCYSIMVMVVMGTYFYQNIGVGQTVLLGSVYLLLNYVQSVGDVFQRFASMYGNVLRQKAGIGNAEEISKSFNEENFANHVLPKDWQNLEIRGLNFSYHDEEEEDGGGGDLHLDDVSLKLSHGERIAFVGSTGSGKTTLLKVIRDLYTPQALVLSVDGVAIPDGFAGVSRAISLVPQDPQIFATNIIDNITMGVPYEPDFVRRFTDMACFTDVVSGLRRGFDSAINEDGVNLSGGQRQRLALARGLLACHDKDIVLLDEPTSSIDVANERRIYENIFAGFEGKTIISTIHQLHLLPMFDIVCVFKNGRIVGVGSYEELLADCEEFKRLIAEGNVERKVEQ